MSTAGAGARELAALERRLRALGVQAGIAAEAGAAEEAETAAGRAVDAAFDDGFGPAFTQAAAVGRLLGRLRIVHAPPAQEAAALYAVAAEKRLESAAQAEFALVAETPPLQVLQKHLGPCTATPLLESTAAADDAQDAEKAC